MFDRDAWRKHGTNSLRQMRTGFAKIDQFCARMNDGLAAIAIVLTIIVLATAVVRVPDLLAQNVDPTATALPDMSTALPE